jgi:heptosyltransferase-2
MMEARGREAGAYLLVRFSSLGDVVIATAAARVLRAARPRARVILATKAAFAPILAAQPDLDEVWPLGAEGLGALIRRVRAARFDAVVDLHGNFRSRLLGLASGAKVSRWRKGSLNRRARVWARPFAGLWAPPPPVYERYAAAAARAVGLPAPERGKAPLPRLGIAPSAAEWAAAWLASAGLGPDEPLLAAAPGAAWRAKRWDAEAFGRCLGLAARAAGARVLLVGSPGESALLDEVAAVAEGIVRGDAGAGGDLTRTAALLKTAGAFLGHDSGPAHVAAALGVPPTVLFGPTVREFGFVPASPEGKVFETALPCRPCSLHGGDACPLGHHDCLRTIAPEAVAEHLAATLASRGRNA